MTAQPTDPLPPAGAQDQPEATERVFGGLDFAAFVGLTALELTAAVLFTVYWLSRGDATDPVFWAATALIAPTFAMWQLRWLALPAMRRPRFVEPQPGLRVAAVTTFVPSAEPIEMLARTVRALTALEYPCASCASVGARHFSRRGMSRYQQRSGRFQARTKHGNYNAWLTEHGFGRYDVVVTFDPDHIPRPEYLRRTLGYLHDGQVVFVQAPRRRA